MPSAAAATRIESAAAAASDEELEPLADRLTKKALVTLPTPRRSQSTCSACSLVRAATGEMQNMQTVVSNRTTSSNDGGAASRGRCGAEAKHLDDDDDEGIAFFFYFMRSMAFLATHFLFLLAFSFALYHLLLSSQFDANVRGLPVPSSCSSSPRQIGGLHRVTSSPPSGEESQLRRSRIVFVETNDLSSEDHGFFSVVLRSLRCRL